MHTWKLEKTFFREVDGKVRMFRESSVEAGSTFIVNGVTHTVVDSFITCYGEEQLVVNPPIKGRLGETVVAHGFKCYESIELVLTGE